MWVVQDICSFIFKEKCGGKEFKRELPAELDI